MPAEKRTSLLAMRVSEVLSLHDGALAVLIEHGFTPLAQQHLRRLLAPTLTLAQALRLKSFSPANERALLDALEALLVEEQRGADASPAGVEQVEVTACR